MTELIFELLVWLSIISTVTRLYSIPTDFLHSVVCFILMLIAVTHLSKHLYFVDNKYSYLGNRFLEYSESRHGMTTKIKSEVSFTTKSIFQVSFFYLVIVIVIETLGQIAT